MKEDDFERFAVELFQYQAQNNKIYRDFIMHLEVDPGQIGHMIEIPFLPIEFFKRFPIKTGEWPEVAKFQSSGTTGAPRSSHYLSDLDQYHKVCVAGFERMYGDLRNYHVLALLPSYLEQGNSSLISMVSHFVDRSGSEHSGFYLNNQEELLAKIDLLAHSRRKTLLLGVSFALLDLADAMAKPNASNLMIMETGGMKGRRNELTREDLHARLKRSFGVPMIHSEYGMTELLSQAYSTGDGIFSSPPWMRVIIRNVLDPRETGLRATAGGMNIIDLANAHSCAFIETKDLGVSVNDRQFTVQGRLDNTDLRGCNLLIS